MKPLKKQGAKRWKPLLVLLAAALASVAVYWGMTWYYADWLPTSGVIQEVRQYRGKGGPSYRIYYTYTVNGAMYTWETMYGGVNEKYTAGDAAEIWYDPDSPSHSFFGRPWPGLYPVLPFIITFPYLGGCLFGAFVRSKKKSRLQ